jgi:hypothetical protein
MARQDYGNDLANNILQPGWKLSDDGFGLHTITATYKTDNTTGFNFLRGDPFTVSAFSYCKLHKQTSSFDALGIQTVVCEFVGIAPDINGGLFTNAQMTTSGGLTTEKIETIYGFTADTYVIAGPPPYTQSPLGPMVSIKNPADFGSQAVSGGAVAVTKQQSFIGANGACFENEDGGKFLGFVDPAYPYFYGKTSYLAPQQTFSGIVYVTDDEMVNKFIKYLSVSSSNGNWDNNLPYIIPTYLSGSGEDGAFVNGDFNQLLLTQSNVESFGDLYKVSYEIKYSEVGWHSNIYTRIQDLA